MVRLARGLIFSSIKRQYWDLAVQQTCSIPGSSNLEVVLDPFRPAALRDSNSIDSNLTQSFVGLLALGFFNLKTLLCCCVSSAQAFIQLKPRLPGLFRLSKRSQAWKTVMSGMSASYLSFEMGRAVVRVFEIRHADDYGGVYREALEHFCREIQSSVLPLFLPTPNCMSILCQPIRFMLRIVLFSSRKVPAVLDATFISDSSSSYSVFRICWRVTWSRRSDRSPALVIPSFSCLEVSCFSASDGI